MSNIIPSVSRENVKTYVSITLGFQFSTVKNQATLKLQTAFQSYLVIFIAFVFFLNLPLTPLKNVLYSKNFEHPSLETKTLLAISVWAAKFIAFC